MKYRIKNKNEFLKRKSIEDKVTWLVWEIIEAKRDCGRLRKGFVYADIENLDYYLATSENTIELLTDERVGA